MGLSKNRVPPSTVVTLRWTSRKIKAYEEMPGIRLAVQVGFFFPEFETEHVAINQWVLKTMMLAEIQ